MLTMSLRPILHSSFVLSLSEPFLEVLLYRYGCAGTCCREIVFEINRRSLWSYRPRACHTFSTSSQPASFPLYTFPKTPSSSDISSLVSRSLYYLLSSSFVSASMPSCSKYSPCAISVIHYLFLPLWHQAADSSLGIGLLRPFPSSRARIEGGTFINNHMRWSEQGLLWGIDSGDHGHYSASRA